MRKIYLLLFIITSINKLIQAQYTVKGRVFDQETKEPLMGVSVLAANSQSGTITDILGDFILELPSKADSIEITLIGYKTTFIVDTATYLTIALTPSIQNLQQVIVSASRDKQERKDVPATVNTIPAQLIKETNPSQLNQLLNKIPGMIMKDLNNEQHMMAIRQPMTSRPYFLYLEDNLPIAPVGNFNHNQLIEVNMLGIRTIEVVKGPASSIYGSNAVGGTINFITLSPTAIPTAKVGLQINTTGYQRLEFFGGKYLTPKFGLSVGGYMARQRNGWQTYSDFDKTSLSAKATYLINSKTDMTTYFTYNFLKTQTGGSIDSLGFYSKKYLANNNFAYRKVNSIRGRVTMNHYWNESSKTNLSILIGNNSIGQNPRYRIKNISKYEASGQENEDSYNNYSLIAQHLQSFKFLKSKLIAGVQTNFAPTEFWATYGNITRDSTTGYYTNYLKTDSLLADYNTFLVGFGSYLQYEFNPVKNLKFVVGMRIDNLTYKFKNSLSVQAFSGIPDTTINNFAFSPKIGITYDFGHSTGIYFNFSRGFSPPQTSDLFFGTTVPVLKPAYFTNYEIGAWTALFKEKLYIDISLYRMIGKDEIISFRLPDNSTENRNSGKTLHQGIEYSLTYKPIDDIFFRIGGTFAVHKYLEYTVQEKQKGELISYNGNYMPEAPKVIMNAELTLKPRFMKGFRTSLEWQYIGPWYKDDANNYRYNDKTFLFKGVSLLNLRTAYNFRGFEIYCNILNLSNELYANSVTRGTNNIDNFAAGAPRTFTFGFLYNFEKTNNKNEK